VIAVNNIFENTKNGLIKGFQAGNMLGMVAAGASYSVNRAGIPISPLPALSWSVSIVAGTATGAVAGLFGTSHPEHPARIASLAAMIFCATPSGEANFDSGIDGTASGNRGILSQIGEIGDSLYYANINAQLGNTILNALTNVARRII